MNAGTTFLFVVLLVWKPHLSTCLQCLLTTLTKERGVVYYTPAPSPQRLTKECSWEFQPPRNEEFVLVTRITSLSSYDGDDRIIMLDGNILDRQTVYDGRNEICFKYILDQSSSNDCLTKLAELHCSKGTLRRLITPVHLSISTRGRIEREPNRYHYTNFKLSYRYHYCPTEEGRNIIIPEQSVLTIQTGIEHSATEDSGVFIFLIILLTLMIPTIGFLLYKILSIRKKNEKKQLERKDAEIDGLQAKNKALESSALSDIPIVVAPAYSEKNPAQVGFAFNASQPPSPLLPPTSPQLSQAPLYSKNPYSGEDATHRVTFQDGNVDNKNESPFTGSDLHSISEVQSPQTYSSRDGYSYSNTTSYDRDSDYWRTRGSEYSGQYSNCNYCGRNRPSRSASDLTARTSYSRFGGYPQYDRGRSRERRLKKTSSYPYLGQTGSSRNLRSVSSLDFRSGRNLRSVSSLDFRSDDDGRYRVLRRQRPYGSRYRSSDESGGRRRRRARSRGGSSYRGRSRDRRRRKYSGSRRSKSRCRRASRRSGRSSRSSMSAASSDGYCCKKKRRSRSRRKRKTSDRSSFEKCCCKTRKKKRHKSSDRWCVFSSPSPCEVTCDSSYATAPGLECCECSFPVLDDQLCRCLECQKLVEAGQSPACCGNERTATYTTRTRDFPSVANRSASPPCLMPCSPCPNKKNTGCSASQETCFKNGRAISASNSTCSLFPCDNRLPSKCKVVNPCDKNQQTAFMLWMAMCLNYKAMQTANQLKKCSEKKPVCPSQLRKVCGPIPRKIACIANCSPRPFRKSKSVVSCSQITDSDTCQSSGICERTAKPISKGRLPSFETFRKMFGKQKRKKVKAIEVSSDEICCECPLREVSRSSGQDTSERRSTCSNSSEKRRALHVTISETSLEPTDGDCKSKRSRSRSRRRRRSSRRRYSDDDDRRSRKRSRRSRSSRRRRRSPSRSRRRWQYDDDLDRFDDGLYKHRSNRALQEQPSLGFPYHPPARPDQPFDTSKQSGSYVHEAHMPQHGAQMPQSWHSLQQYDERFGSSGHNPYVERYSARLRPRPPRHLQFEDMGPSRAPTRSILSNRSNIPASLSQNFQQYNPIQASQYYPPQTTPTPCYFDPSGPHGNVAQPQQQSYAPVGSVYGSGVQAQPQITEDVTQLYSINEAITTEATPEAPAEEGESTEGKPKKRRRRRRHRTKTTDDTSENQSGQSEDQAKEGEDNYEASESKQAEDESGEQSSSRRRHKRRSHKSKSEGDAEAKDDEAKGEDESGSKKRRRRSKKSKSSESNADEYEEEKSKEDDNDSGEQKSHRRRSSSRKSKEGEESKSVDDDSEKRSSRRRKSSRKSESEKTGDEKSSENRSSRRSQRSSKKKE